MSSTRQYIYISLFGLIVLTLFFGIFKLIQKNNLSKQSFNVSQSAISTSETKIINWEDASKLMENCQIKSVFQKHDLTVTLRTYDNQIFQTIEPQIDDIFKLAKKYQSPCDIIQMITE